MPQIMPFAQMIGFLLTLGFVIVLAVITTRFVAGQRLRGFGNKNIKIIESIGVGHQSSICILQVGTKGSYMLVGITKENITFLQNIDNDIISISQEENNKASFGKYLEKYIRKGEQYDSEKKE